MRKLLILIVLGILLLGCTQPSPTPAPTPNPSPAPAEITVHIQNFAFVPAQITVKQGTTVTWINDDQISHTVKFPAFESGQLAQGSTFSHVFSEDIGGYQYICGDHPSMRGVVTVTK